MLGQNGFFTEKLLREPDGLSPLTASQSPGPAGANLLPPTPKLPDLPHASFHMHFLSITLPTPVFDDQVRLPGGGEKPNLRVREDL